jgi:hypothetical protein
MKLEHIATPAGLVVLFPLFAHADAFDWNLADTVESGPLGPSGGGLVSYRTGFIPQGEHVEVAVELTWTADDGQTSVTGQVIHTMADSPAAVTMDGDTVTVTLAHLPWGQEVEQVSKQCFSFDATAARFDQIPCP